MATCACQLRVSRGLSFHGDAHDHIRVSQASQAAMPIRTGEEKPGLHDVLKAMGAGNTARNIRAGKKVSGLWFRQARLSYALLWKLFMSDLFCIMQSGGSILFVPAAALQACTGSSHPDKGRDKAMDRQGSETSEWLQSAKLKRRPFQRSAAMSLALYCCQGAIAWICSPCCLEQWACI